MFEEYLPSFGLCSIKFQIMRQAAKVPNDNQTVQFSLFFAILSKTVELVFQITQVYIHSFSGPCIQRSRLLHLFRSKKNGLVWRSETPSRYSFLIGNYDPRMTRLTQNLSEKPRIASISSSEWMRSVRRDNDRALEN